MLLCAKLRQQVIKTVFLPRVRDWKGYGIVQQCGTCEPLQSPTDVALERMICRAMEGTPKP